MKETFADLIAASVVHPYLHNLGPEGRAAREELTQLLSPKPAIAAQRFVIDNVAEYEWSSGRFNNDVTNKDDYPCLIPPFPLMWMEYDRPPTFIPPKTTEPVSTASWSVARYGVRVERYTEDELPGHAEVILTSMREQKKLPLEGLKWVVCLAMFIQENGRITGPTLMEYLFLDELGRSIDKVDVSYGQSHDPDWYGKFLYGFTPFRRALSFLNTRGIKHDEYTPKPKASKVWEKKTGQPLLTHKTLVVQSVLPSGATRSGGSGEKSHHIRRGHFKDYRDGSGLFGKHKILVWVESHVAGDRAVGTVEKNYDVHLPSEGTQP